MSKNAFNIIWLLEIKGINMRMLTEKNKNYISESPLPFKNSAAFEIWCKEHEPEDSYLWKKEWWNRNRFIKDKILKIFDFKYNIIGSHYSKSVECPVILITYKNVDIILQYNFYDWQIMIKSEKPIILKDLDLYNATGDYFFYQGIPDKYCFKKYSNTNNKQFAIDIQDDLFNVYGFMIMLKQAINNAVMVN